MPCPKCGAKHGHKRGCPTQAGQRSDRGRKKAGKDKSGRVTKSRPCFDCKGTGMKDGKVCATCDGTGEKK